MGLFSSKKKNESSGLGGNNSMGLGGSLGSRDVGKPKDTDTEKGGTCPVDKPKASVEKPKRGAAVGAFAGMCSASKIEIDTVAVRDIAEEIRAINTDMTRSAGCITFYVEQYVKSWKSSVHDDFLKRIKKTEDVYNSYSETIEQFACFLEQTAEQYEDNEKNIARKN